jgi:hypothetical protein
MGKIVSFNDFTVFTHFLVRRVQLGQETDTMYGWDLVSDDMLKSLRGLRHSV